MNEMNEVLSGESLGQVLDPNRLFVKTMSSRSSSARGSSVRGSSATECPEETLKPLIERMKFGLAWINLTYSPKMLMSDNTKTILNQISGQIKFGQIVGLMGPSGCGKSTLLRCINGRIASGLSTETQIFVNTRRTIHSCFIVQDQKEHLLMNLTTRESLLYASKIKNPVSIESESDETKTEDGFMSSTLGLIGLTQSSNIDHNTNVNKLMTGLTLCDCADTLVANCSGGQQKRIVIALELVAEEKPNIMCIDEPTSGLDSNAAEQVIECLKGVCEEHSIGIITTIHQPNSDILMLFDSLYVLSKGGFCIYDGKPQLIRQFMEMANISIGETQVPIEVLIKVASMTLQISADSEQFGVHVFVKELAKNTREGWDDIRRDCLLYGKLTDPKHINVGAIWFTFNDFWFLMMRTFTSALIRSWKSLSALLVFELGAGITNALLFGECGVDDGCIPYNPYEPQNVTCIPIDPAEVGKEPEIFKNFKLLFFSLLFHCFLQLCYTVLTFPMEVKIFFNEQQNRWYSSGAYYWAKNIVDTLIAFTITVLYTIPLYYLTAQIGELYERRFGLFLLANLLAAFCSQGMSYTVSIIASNSLKISLMLAISGNLVNSLFSGFLLPVKEMNSFMQTISGISYTKASFEIQMFAIYGFDRCDPKRNQWSQTLYQMGVTEEDYRLDLYLLIAQTIVWRIVALICLIIKTNDFKINTKLFIKKSNEIKIISNEV